VIASLPRSGKGRQPKHVEDLRDRRDELEAHRQEALAFADLCWPLLSRLEVVAREIGPLALQTVLILEVHLARYERRPSTAGSTRRCHGGRLMNRVRRLVLVTSLLAAAFGAGQVSAVGSSPDEQALRTRLLACAILDEARERGISLSRLTTTRIQCLGLR